LKMKALSLKNIFPFLLISCVIFGIISMAYDDEDLVVEEEVIEAQPARPSVSMTREQRAMQGHPLTNMPPPSDDMVAAYYFPKHPDLQLPIGQKVGMLCHLENQGENDFNISAIMGSLNDNYNFNFFIQNFTMKPVGEAMSAGVEYTLAYDIQLHPQLPPNAYRLATSVFYQDGQRWYSSACVNETVTLFHADPAFSPQDLLKLGTTLGAGALFLYVFFTAAFGEGFGGGSGKGRPPSSAAGRGDPDDQSDSKGSRKKGGSSSSKSSKKKVGGSKRK